MLLGLWKPCRAALFEVRVMSCLPVGAWVTGRALCVCVCVCLCVCVLPVCDRYVVLANMLSLSRINPFDTQEAKVYALLP